MGRILFSQSYPTAPAVRIEPEPTVDHCGRWSMWNRFDPDSEDFFQDAEYEAFIDPVQYQREQEELAAAAQADVAAESSDSSEGSGSERGSPMAVGSDDPAILIATYANHPWSNAPTSGWQPPTADNSSVTAGVTYNPRNMQSIFGSRPRELMEDSDHLDNPVFIPPASFRAPSPGIEPDSNPSSSPPRSPTLRRTVDITPITVMTNPQVVFMSPTRSPSPDTPAPSTPPPLMYQASSAMLTPSPAPSATPRFYSWQRHSIPAFPPSPTLSRGNRDGPFTNPHARVSLMRIDAATARIRHSNIVT